jgi:hypothetical protein
VTAYNGLPEAQLLDPLTLAPLHTKRAIDGTAGLAVPSQDGGQVSIGGVIYDLASGERRQLPAPVYCFLQGRRFVSRRCDATEFRMSGDWLWRLAVPFLRHSCPHNDAGQAVVFNLDTGKETFASPNFPREAFYEFRSSTDGKVAVGASLWGKFRLWRVPD